MSSPKVKATSSGTRQSAYVARNRAALLNAGREILALYGPGVTVEAIVEHAQVSPATLYKYFGSREGFLGAAQESLWQEWESWALDHASKVREPLERFITPIRLLIRVSTTHPQFTKALKHSTTDPDFLIQHLGKNSHKEVKALARAGVVSGENFEDRFLLFAYSVVAIVKKSISQSPAKAKESEKMLTIALGLLGVDEKEAKKALSTKLALSK